MITKNPMQLKAFVKNKAAEKHVSAQLIMQSYMLERLVERISCSPYKNSFILKGGYLISAIVGIQSRTTMDLDTTITGFTLTHDSIRSIFEDVCTIDLEDDVQFKLLGVSDIRETDDYPGIRVSLKAEYLPISISLTVDVTTGDVVTPGAISYSFPLLFENRSIEMLAYNLETVLAEKLETILSRNIASTRPRDFYDVYVLYSLHKDTLNINTLSSALEKTANKRQSLNILKDYELILETISNSDFLHSQWEKYRSNYEYAAHITFSEVCAVIRESLSRTFDVLTVS